VNSKKACYYCSIGKVWCITEGEEPSVRLKKGKALASRKMQRRSSPSEDSEEESPTPLHSKGERQTKR
jgi:hypothetical protein